MNKQAITVVDNNKHLGQIVSGSDQEQKNIDERIKEGRQSIFGLLGPAFSYKCHLSPKVKLQIYRTYTCPITRSGFSVFSLRPTQLEPLKLFQRKIMRGILHFSSSAPTPQCSLLMLLTPNRRQTP